MTSRRSGSLLIITLWLVAILSVLAVAIAKSLSREIRLSKYRLAREQARALARGGVYLARQRLADDKAEDDYDWLRDDWAQAPSAPGGSGGSAPWAVPLATAQAGGTGTAQRIEIQIADEERKLPLNATPVATLTALLGKLGTQQAPEVAQAIVDYVDSDSPPDPAEHRPQQEPPYYAKNGPVARLEELRDIPALDEETIAGLQGWVSPHERKPASVNINTASLETLELFGTSSSTWPTVVAAIGEFRQQDGGVFKTVGEIANTLGSRVVLEDEDETLLRNTTLFGVASETFTVISEGIVDAPPVRIRVEAVIRRTDCGQGAPTPCIVAWKEL